MLDSDALGFGRQVLEVMNALTDGDAGWPKNGNSGDPQALSVQEAVVIYAMKRSSGITSIEEFIVCSDEQGTLT